MVTEQEQSVRSRIIFDENDGATGGWSDESTSSGDIKNLPSGGRKRWPCTTINLVHVDAAVCAVRNAQCALFLPSNGVVPIPVRPHTIHKNIKIHWNRVFSLAVLWVGGHQADRLRVGFCQGIDGGL